MRSIRALRALAALLAAALACNQPGLQPTAQSSVTEPAEQVASAPDLAGLWTGEFHEITGDLRTFSATLEILRASDGSITGTFGISQADGSFKESYAINGTINEQGIRFSESGGRFFSASVAKEQMTGFVAWKCYDCEYWGAFELTRQGGTVSGPPVEAPSAALVRFVDVADGGTIGASVDPITGFPRATVRIESSVDDSQLSIGLDANGLMVSHTGYESHASLPFQRDLTWTPWEGNGQYVLNVQLLDWDTAHQVLSSQQIVVNVTGIPDSTPSVRQRFIDLYRQDFGITLTAPAFARYNKLFAEALDAARWVSTAYIGDRVYELAIFDDGTVGSTSSIVSSDSGAYCRPIGTIDMLAVIVDYGNTGVDPAAVAADLAFSADRSNQRWARYSANIGFSEPILHVNLTTVTAGAPPAPGQFLTVDQVRALTGYDTAGFDVTAEIDLDADNVTVGQFGGLGVSLGGGCRPSGSNSVNIGMDVIQPDFQPGDGVGGSVFDHELIHGMGWMHWWPNGLADSRSWIDTYDAWNPYLLFGWTDTDGDGLIEIQDPTPYGLQ
ncbi:MAG TPA: hypothetical protein VGJ22_11815 [Anaerolineales bacterium]|jgi:hypothetical protein